MLFVKIICLIFYYLTHTIIKNKENMRLHDCIKSTNFILSLKVLLIILPINNILLLILAAINVLTIHALTFGMAYNLINIVYNKRYN